MNSIKQWQEDSSVVIGVTHETLEQALLDRKCWENCGKTREWSDYVGTLYPSAGDKMWKAQWHEFIMHLADGKSIEDALTAITN